MERAISMEQTATAVSRVTAEEVKARMDRGEPLVLLDVRKPEDWASSDVKLPGAIRIPLDELPARISEVPKGRAIITYCT
jgi:rhodanese-related sulfurtransferase